MPCKYCESVKREPHTPRSQKLPFNDTSISVWTSQSPPSATPQSLQNTIKAETLWAVPAQAAKRADQSEQTGPFGMLKRQALKWNQRKLLLLEKKTQLWSNQDSLLKVFLNSLFLSNSNQHKMTCWNDRLKSKYHTGTKRTQWTVEVR